MASLPTCQHSILEFIMRLHLFLLASALAECHIHISGKPSSHENCLSEDEAISITDDFGKVLYRHEGWPGIAERLIAPDFWHQSDGAAFARSKPLNKTRTRQDFLDLEGNTPTPLGYWDNHFVGHTCNTITWYRTWLPKEPPIRSMSILFVDPSTRQVNRHYMETNSGALMYQLGRPECKGDFTWSVAQDGLPNDIAGCEKGCGKET
ncbi:hypothetical protein AC578_8887 [Pseudocercospora eumusae]|uniref:NTF2-like domain-containing protein n=1 Tax=Pseudocercospora eumusae TaxID=321146 RepID=A0A139HBQ7_9PEZI|nr:hypothetical protein AC578_8887 [Pseudocercospora eumusae]